MCLKINNSLFSTLSHTELLCRIRSMIPFEWVGGLLWKFVCQTLFFECSANASDFYHWNTGSSKIEQWQVEQAFDSDKWQVEQAFDSDDGTRRNATVFSRLTSLSLSRRHHLLRGADLPVAPRPSVAQPPQGRSADLKQLGPGRRARRFEPQLVTVKYKLI